MELSSKLKSFIASPKKVFYFLLNAWRRRQIKRVEINGKVFYKYQGELYPEYLNKSNAMAFILNRAKDFCKGKGIDVGAGRFPFPGAIPIENEENQNAYRLDNFKDGSLDYVFSSHCLEHLEQWKYALKLWISKLKTGGILFLYIPHKSMKLWNVNGPWVSDNHKWIPTYEVVNKFLSENGMKILEYNSSRDAYWSFHIVAKKIK
jgi:predicted SAM-dependent methyltransferase